MSTSLIAPGFVTSYGGLITARVFLGLVEGPLTSGIIIYLSSFYTRKELSLRYLSLLFWRFPSFADRIEMRYIRHRVLKYWIKCFSIPTSPQFSSAFSGLLAAAIENMNGIGGRPGWAGIFILVSFYSVFQFVAILNHFNRKECFRVSLNCWFLCCAFYTPRFQVFNWRPERVGPFNSCIALLYVLIYLSSGSS